MSVNLKFFKRKRNWFPKNELQIMITFVFKSPITRPAYFRLVFTQFKRIFMHSSFANTVFLPGSSFMSCDALDNFSFLFFMRNLVAFAHNSFYCWTKISNPGLFGSLPCNCTAIQACCESKNSENTLEHASPTCTQSFLPSHLSWF